MSNELKLKANEYAKLYWNALIQDAMPFWVKHSPDREYGGFFTCLDTEGNVFDTDKFMWLQGREVWMLSKLYNVTDESVVPKAMRDEWLQLARQGAKFLADHGRDSKGRYYFALDRKGAPITAPFSIFSDGFAAMAFAQFYKATKEEWARKLAMEAFHSFENRRSNPVQEWDKGIPGSRPMRMLSVYMIDLNLCLEMKDAIPELDVQKTIDESIDLSLNTFLIKEKGFFREFVAEDKSLETFETRLVNPGHSIEALWFIIDAVQKNPKYPNRDDVIQRCTDYIIKTIEYGWDHEYGGIFYFKDVKGYPPQQLEHDQKLWWVHSETLVALSLAFRLTNREDVAKWYNIIHKYTWDHFPDPKHGEWFGYLNRRGEVSLQQKGGKWKGCFHVPRTLLYCFQNFQLISES